MTFAGLMRSILGVILVGFSVIALAEEILSRRVEQKMAMEAHAWWYHPGTLLLITGIFVAGLHLFYAGFVRPLVRGRGLTPGPERG
jgi:hypothetical protein